MIWTTSVALLLAVGFIVILINLLRQTARKEQFQQKLLDERTAFFTNITHEFRTPLTVILGFARQLQETANARRESPQQIGQLIERQGSHLLQLVNQLLDISKVRSAIGTPEWRNGELVAFVSAIVESHRHLALAKRLSLTFESNQSSHAADFVPDYITKIVQNLVSNAIKYTPDGGQVHVKLHVGEQHETVLRVADNGMGIPTADQARIFDPFFVSHRAAGSGSVGIGLYLTQQLVVALQGTIQVQSDGRRGSTFVVRWPDPKLDTPAHPLGTADAEAMVGAPLASEPPPAAASESAPELPAYTPPRAVAGAPENAPLVLVVEDNPDVAFYIQTLLWRDYRLASAISGEEAWDKALEIMPDLIISDIMMGGMDGIALCQKVRRTPAIDHTPIVLVTAKAGVETRIEGIKAGANAFLTKPFNADELRATVEHLLRHHLRLRSKFHHPSPASSDAPASVETTAERSFSPQEQAFLLKLDDAIAQQVRDASINVERLAEALFMSSSQLRRKLQAITGDKVATYVLRIRMTKAKQLLDAHPDLSISEVADRCGFYDLAHFSKQFKVYYKMTPTQYRRNPILQGPSGE